MLAYFLVGLLLGPCAGAAGLCLFLANRLGNVWDDVA